MGRQKGVERRVLPPRPPPVGLHMATPRYDPAWDSPAPEGTQQLVIAALRLVAPPDKDAGKAPPMPPPFTGHRLVVKAQAAELGVNGRRTVAIHFMWPRRGVGAATGTRRLSKLDRFLERILGYVPVPGEFPLEQLIGLNFVSTVVRYRQRILYEGITQWHFVAKFEVEDCRFGLGARRLYDDWPAWEPAYTLHDRERIFVPREIQDALL